MNDDTTLIRLEYTFSFMEYTLYFIEYANVNMIFSTKNTFYT